LGLVASLNRPGANVTGIARHMLPAISPDREYALAGGLMS
jgi:hypothetical protein